jgi:predicted transcriptional regulator
MKVTAMPLALLVFLAGCASPAYRSIHEQQDPAQVDTLTKLVQEWTDMSGEISYRMRTLQSQINDLRDRTKSEAEEAERLRSELNKILEKRMEALRIEEELLRELDRVQQLDQEQRKALIQKVNRFIDELKAQPAPRPVPSKAAVNVDL